MPVTLLDRLQRILPLGKRVADDIVCEETEILDKATQRMFEVMRKVAEFSCNYVKGSSQSGFGLTSTDVHSEIGWWDGPPREDRRNGQRVDQGN